MSETGTATGKSKKNAHDIDTTSGDLVSKFPDVSKYPKAPKVVDTTVEDLAIGDWVTHNHKVNIEWVDDHDEKVPGEGPAGPFGHRGQYSP